MSEVEKKEVDKTTDSPAQEEKGNEVKKEEEIKVESDKVDYKAELEKAKDKISKAEFTIEKLKKESKSNNTKDDDADEQEIEDKATRIAEATSQKVRQEMVQDVIAEEISNRAESPEHAELLKLYYDKRIVKSGFSREAIKEDLDIAAMLVNKPKLEATMKELKQKAISNGTKNTGGQVSAKADRPEDTIQLSDADRRIMQRFGLKESDINK
jgi:hypothetical protein